MCRALSLEFRICLHFCILLFHKAILMWIILYKYFCDIFSCVKVLKINNFLIGKHLSHTLVACTICDMTLGSLTIWHFSTHKKWNSADLPCLSELAYLHNRLKARFAIYHSRKAQTVDKGIALPCFNSGARRRWVVISVLHSLYCQERDPKPIGRRMGGPHILTGVWTPDLPAFSELLCQLCCLGCCISLCLGKWSVGSCVF